MHVPTREQGSGGKQEKKFAMGKDRPWWLQLEGRPSWHWIRVLSHQVNRHPRLSFAVSCALTGTALFGAHHWGERESGLRAVTESLIFVGFLAPTSVWVNRYLVRRRRRQAAAGAPGSQ